MQCVIHEIGTCRSYGAKPRRAVDGYKHSSLRDSLSGSIIFARKQEYFRLLGRGSQAGQAACMSTLAFARVASIEK